MAHQTLLRRNEVPEGYIRQEDFEDALNNPEKVVAGLSEEHGLCVFIGGNNLKVINIKGQVLVSEYSVSFLLDNLPEDLNWVRVYPNQKDLLFDVADDLSLHF